MTKFNRLWEECAQEEARMAAREEKLGDEEDQALAAHTRKGKGKKGSHSPKKSQKPQRSQQRKRDLSQIRCFSCQKMGHLARVCHMQKIKVRKENSKDILFML